MKDVAPAKAEPARRPDPSTPLRDTHADQAQLREALRRAGIQPKLEIGAVDDPLEREADEIAEQLMRMPDSAASVGAVAAVVQRQSTSCRTAEDDRRMRSEAAVRVGRQAIAPPEVEEVLRSPGQPLDSETRGFFEPRLGQDLSQVRVHTDARAAESAQAVDALAYTVRQDVVFAGGKYAPATSNGKWLMAHELAHVQQHACPETVSRVVPPLIRREREQRSTEATLFNSALTELEAGTLDLDDLKKWEALAANVKDVRGHGTGLQAYFKRAIDAGRLTFENITEDQRSMFLLIDATPREALRKVAVQKSRLFEVLTEMQLETHTAAERAAVAAQRVNPDKVEGEDVYPNSLAGMFANYSILPEVLVSEVGAAKAANEPLANHVRKLKEKYKEDAGALVQELVAGTWWMACGLGNLFALSASRGLAAPTAAGARQWLKEVVLDQPPDKALVQLGKGKGRFIFSTNEVLTTLSRSKHQPKYAAQQASLTKKESPARFQAALERSSRGVSARVGIVQGRGKTGHMYITYRDIDGIWRTMDMYMSIADRPGGGLPYSEHYATETQWHKLVVD